MVERAKQALKEVASTEAGVAGACRAAAKSVHRIIAVITARFDRLELHPAGRQEPKGGNEPRKLALPSSVACCRRN